MPTALAIPVAALGAALALLAFYDAALAVLHPSRRGWLSARVNRLVFNLVRGPSRRRRPALLQALGPLALAANFLVWLAGLGMGFTLVYWPFVASLGYSGPGRAPDGFVEALYLSGTSLSTVGFGDVVATSDVLRIVTIAEGAAGLTAFTATVTYLLAVYGVISELRTAAAHAHDLGTGDAPGATAFLLHGGAPEAVRLQRELIDNQQHLRRFPVLLAFHPPRAEESLYTLLRGAFMLHLVLRFGVGSAGIGFAPRLAGAYGQTLDRVMADLRADFLSGRDAPVEPDDQPLPDRRAAARLRALRAAVATVDPGIAATETGPEGDVEDEDEVRLFARDLGRAEGFLAALADLHGYEHAELVPVDDPLPSGAIRLAPPARASA